MSNERILNIGVMAHVDGGKTTLIENILFQAKAIREKGDVNKGSSKTDNLELERQRGITIRNSTVSINWGDEKFNLIDTPGHFDFASEVERVIPAIDVAVVIISAAESVQAHTENIWGALRKMKVPTLFFINKIDRIGVEIGKVKSDLQNLVQRKIIYLTEPVNCGTVNANINSEKVNLFCKKNFNDLSDNLFEEIISENDLLLEKYFNAEIISPNDIYATLIDLFFDMKFIPVIFGVAKKDIGTVELLDFLKNYFLHFPLKNAKRKQGYIYNIESDEKLGKLASIRMFSGELNSRDVIFNARTNREIKITRIKKIEGYKLVDSSRLFPNDIGKIIVDSNVSAGDFIGEVHELMNKIGLARPIMKVNVLPINLSEITKLIDALKELNYEDPNLNLDVSEETKEINIDVMGKIHIEILGSFLKTRFNINVRFSEPIIIYKETPIGRGFAFEEYTMPKPCWAIVKFLIEPLERGVGIVFESEVSVNDIAAKYQNEIKRAIPLSLKQGNYGWEVVDLRIHLVGGEHHEIHSRPGDFKLATPMAILKGLKKIGTNILEPIVKFKIKTPEEYLGKIMSEFSLLRASSETPKFINNEYIVEGLMPASNAVDYPLQLIDATSGKAKFSYSFFGYEECEVKNAVVIPYKGISPLDRSKYILQHRGALK